MKHGISFDIHRNEDLENDQTLPSEIASGETEEARRESWGGFPSQDYGLPAETWREHVARRRRYHEVRSKLQEGEVNAINDLVTYGLDIGTFAQDVIAQSE